MWQSLKRIQPMPTDEVPRAGGRAGLLNASIGPVPDGGELAEGTEPTIANMIRAGQNAAVSAGATVAGNALKQAVYAHDHNLMQGVGENALIGGGLGGLHALSFGHL
jgi:hypothetical protein